MQQNDPLTGSSSYHRVISFDESQWFSIPRLRGQTFGEADERAIRFVDYYRANQINIDGALKHIADSYPTLDEGRQIREDCRGVFGLVYVGRKLVRIIHMGGTWPNYFVERVEEKSDFF